jgi:Ni,Fe-hydrogenase III large subunit/Ni,Fe-hydrogenase III component G
MKIDQVLNTLPAGKFLELPRRASNQRHFFIRDAQILRQILEWGNQQGYNLCNLMATDDRLLIDSAFKLYYFLSGAEDEIVVLEHPVPASPQPAYRSVADIFPNAHPLEREIRDMFGMITEEVEDLTEGFILHSAVYPADFYPLRRRRTLENLRNRLQAFSSSPSDNLPIRLPEGILIVPVGPIHAGIIEAGHFPFHVAGEVVEKLPLRLGYKHRGIEKLFETHYTIQNGWQLAEKVSGDSSVAHAIAYCQAVEDLAQVELPLTVHLWRAIFLELERMYNHISDIGLLATGMAYEQAASSLATLRELFVQFVNVPLSGNRFLRGLNQPGKVLLPDSINLGDVLPRLEAITEEALEEGKKIMENQGCRERMISTGTLTRSEARCATGLVARASGWFEHDFRIRHPSPAYAPQDVQAMLQKTITAEEVFSPRLAPVYQHDLKGDVFARMVIRVAEIETSLCLVKYFVNKLSGESAYPASDRLEQALNKVPEMSMGLGYAEGWRGDVMYVVFKGMENTIARCKVRDPSVFNWHVFSQAVQRKKDEKGGFLENILADFPLINKSFNLSYAGHDV